MEVANESVVDSDSLRLRDRALGDQRPERATVGRLGGAGRDSSCARGRRWCASSAQGGRAAPARQEADSGQARQQVLVHDVTPFALLPFVLTLRKSSGLQPPC